MEAKRILKNIDFMLNFFDCDSLEASKRACQRLGIEKRVIAKLNTEII
tara:strand:- start:2218 stop:2361 length:144 start_codon:yes stop_codon:yes gene_type:complete